MWFYFPCWMVCTFTSALCEVCVPYPMWLFSVVSWFRAFSRYIAEVFFEWFWDGSGCPCYYWYHFCFYIPHALYFYFRIFTASFVITFLSPEIATYISIHVTFSLSLIMMSGLLLRMFLSVYTFDSIIWSLCLQDLFLLMLVHAHTSVLCQILSQFPCVC